MYGDEQEEEEAVEEAPSSILLRLKEEQLKRMAPEDSGKNAETVYRDKKGKKLDMLNEFMRQQAVRDGKVPHYSICSTMTYHRKYN